VANKQAKYAKEIGLDLIITDHHLPAEELPEAEAIVHSTKFCGAGVAWCLTKAMVSEKSADNLLDLVAIATVCDLTQLLKANRCLVKIGLEKLNKTARVGLIALINEARLTKGEIEAYHIGHIIGPRLNALGRLEHAMDSLRLLCTKDPVKARNFAKTLTKANEEKKQLTIDAIDEAKEIIKQIEVKKKIIIVSSNKWIPGIMGLVAGRLVDEYGLPAIAISITDGMAKGSARSISGVNIVEAIRKCRNLLIDVGGHPKAAGFSIETANIEQFKKELERIMEKEDIVEGGKIKVEVILKTDQINRNLLDKLAQFEPTGVENPKPILASEEMHISDIRTVGNGKHLKFKSNGFDAIAFSMGDLAGLLSGHPVCDIAYSLDLDTFNGSEKIQLKVIDLQL
jgi:single-stranded-DNA-specific exonuclease